jgi:rubrerythrin
MSANNTSCSTTSPHPHWKCGKCGNTIQAPTPPEICPSCKEKCLFKDVTCYTPDCGGPGGVDPRL